MSSLIIGGTGTLGYAVTDKLICKGEDVTVFSRDELKQQEMRSHFGYSHKLQFVLGDVRDYSAVHDAISRHSNIYLFSAMKHVSSGENHPQECLKTNVNGAINVLAACSALRNIKPRNLVFSSTDKAVRPINAYGASKLMAEKILLCEKNQAPNLRISVCRYGNVIGSRGSALKMFVDSLRKNEPVNITDLDMTRFWIRIEQAADFVINACGERGLHIPGIKASRITDVVSACATIMGKSTWTHKVIGIQPGEKLHEELTEGLDSGTCPQFTKDELIELIRPDVERLMNG